MNTFSFFSFFDEIPLGEQKSPKWDAAFCGVTSGANSVCLCPIKRPPLGLYGLITLQNVQFSKHGLIWNNKSLILFCTCISRIWNLKEFTFNRQKITSRQ